jgi:hypothetical protein
MSVRILGQPEITDYAVTLQLKCSCGQHILLVGVVGVVKQCPECKRYYRVNGRPFFDADGHIQVPLGMAAGSKTEPVQP